MNGRRILETREVMANIRRAKVPTRVAASQVALISAPVIFGFFSKIGLT